jgi:hypothetical protein
MKLDCGDHKHYDIMTTLRGPDVENSIDYPLKYIFSARLRQMVAARSYGLQRNEHIDEAYFNTVMMNLEELKQHRHYLLHCAGGFYALSLISEEHSDEARSLSRLARVLLDYTTFDCNADEVLMVWKEQYED